MKLGTWLFSALFCFVCLADTPQSYADIVFTSSGTFDAVGGDTLGLDGANYTFTAAFDCDDEYISVPGVGGPLVHSLSNSLEIIGSASDDGVYVAPDTVNFFPNFNGQYFGGFSGGSNISFDLPGGEDLRIVRLTSNVSGVSVGDLIDMSHFSLTPSNGLARFDTGALGDVYDITNFSASVVPEPAATLLLTLVGGVALSRRRR